MHVDISNIPDFQAGSLNLPPQAHEILVGGKIGMQPDGDVIHPELIHELEVFVAGVRPQLDRDLNAGRKIVEHRCAGERARGEGCAAQCPRQSPLGKLSPSRIEVSFPRCSSECGSLCWMPSQYHSLGMARGAGNRGRRRRPQGRTRRPRRPAKDGAILTGRRGKSRWKGTGIHAATGYGISRCRVARAHTQAPPRLEGRLAIWATAQATRSRKAKTHQTLPIARL